MLKRKVETVLQDWKKNPSRKPLVIKGVRQCGKTFSVQRFAGGNLLGYKGAIFENIIADAFSKMGRGLYYYRKESGLEVDFLMRYKGRCTLVEVKSTTGNIKSTKTILKNKNVYHVNSAIKLGKYGVGRSDEMLTLPLYMSFLLTAY